MTAEEVKAKARELIEASKKATTHRGKWIADIDSHDWVDKVKVENLGVVCRVEKARFEDSTFNNADFIALCGNNASEVAQAYLDKCAELDRATTAINGALIELREIASMEPELEHPSLKLYRFDDRDMECVKQAKELLEDFLAGKVAE